jgi:hypothetical protein
MHRSERPVLLAVDQESGNHPGLQVPVARANPMSPIASQARSRMRFATRRLARAHRRPPPLRRWQARARRPPPKAAIYGTGAQQGCGSRGERVESPWGPGLAPSSVRHGSEQSIGTDRKVHRRYGKPKGRTDNRRLKGQAEGYSEPPLSFRSTGIRQMPGTDIAPNPDPWFLAMVLSWSHPSGRGCSMASMRPVER